MKKRKITIISMIIITLTIVIFSGVSIFSNNDKNANKTLAYFYDGEGHSNPPSKDSYEVDVVNCNKAVGNWSNKDWTITLSDIEGKAECIVSFKKKLSVFNLKIDPNGGTYKERTGIQSVDIKETNNYQLDVPTRKGYTFAGWDVEGEQSKVNQNTFTMGIENSKITAKWEVNKYTITISGTNACDKEVEVNYGEYVDLCTPSKEGYTFIGWNVETEDNKYKVEDKDVTITPKWQVNNYNYIVYHKKQGINGGYEVVDTQTGNAAFNTSVSPNTKSYTGFTSPQKKTITISSDTNTNVITYEYTRNKYTLTINPNGGTTSTQNQEVYYEGQVNVVSPTKPGYTFTSWSGATLQDTTLTMPASNVTLSANYTANTYTIYFDANGGSVSPTQKSVTYNSTYGILPTPTREGYTFNGWFINGTKIESTSVVKITQATSAVANWTKNSYILTINSNGGTYNNSTSNYQKGMEYQEEFTVADPTRVGYTFNGWEVEGTNATYDSSTKVFKMGSSNATLSAKWTINKYKLTIEGTNACDGEFNLDYQETKTLCTPVNEGHTFAGWEDNDSLIQNDVVTVKAKDSTIRAKWTANTYNYIVYHNKMNLDGTTYTRVDADTYNSSGEYGTVIVTNAKRYTGFKALENKAITIGLENNNPPTNNVVNYNYEREKHTFTIDIIGIEDIEDIVKELYFEEQTAVEVPEKEGYRVSISTPDHACPLGRPDYYCRKYTYNDGIFTMGTWDVVFDAEYYPKSYVVTFNPNGGSVTTTSKNVLYNKTYGELPTQIRTNYDFLGWYTEAEGGTKVESTDTYNIADNQTLYAHWKLSTITITYNANGGSVSPTSVQITKGSSISSLPTPTRSNYTFMGWYDSTSCTNKITTDTTFNTSTTIYAHWLSSNGVEFINGLESCYDDSLLRDGTSDNNLRYAGARRNINNYVSFNNELWQIIGVMNNIQTSDGQTKSLLKIIRNESLGSYSWDSSASNVNNGRGINQWGPSGSYEGADLMRELNNDYLGNVVVGTDGMWYDGTNNSKSSTKPTSIIGSLAQNMIQDVVWYLGAPNNNAGTYITDGLTASYVYTHERANTNGKICTYGTNCNDTVIRTSTWTGKIGLIYPSDYLYATSGGSTSGRNTCLNTSMESLPQSSDVCRSNNWLYRNGQVYLSPGVIWGDISTCLNTDKTMCFYEAYYVYHDMYGPPSRFTSAYVDSIYPSLYLKSTTKITGGTGTSTDPYILAQ